MICGVAAAATVEVRVRAWAALMKEIDPSIVDWGDGGESKRERRKVRGSAALKITFDE
jgi:hypothetical protein